MNRYISWLSFVMNTTDRYAMVCRIKGYYNIQYTHFDPRAYIYI